MSYSYNRFLKPLSESDKTIKIYDDRNFPVHTVNPFAVLRIYVSGNNLSVALSGNRIIVLDFPNAEECKEGLAKLQSYVDRLKAVAPVIIDKGVDSYVEQAIASSGGIKSFNGSTASIQSFSVTNDDNIEIDISLSDQIIVGATGSTSSSWEGIHNLSVKWTGILPIERGGLNNTFFNSGELLISSSESIVSSGYKINDAGFAKTDLWSAEKIIKQISGSLINKEVPTGRVDGVNRTFFLTFIPIKNSEHIYLNGLLQDGDYDTDYTILGNKITFVEPPIAASKIKCTYMPSRTGSKV